MSIDMAICTTLGARRLIPCHLTYSIADPYAVRLDCHIDTPRPISWLFARDLLLRGLWQRAGIGDVQVQPGTGRECGHLFIALGKGPGQAVLRACAWDMDDFLRRTEQLVPPGLEHDHLDTETLLNKLRAARPGR